MANNGHIKKGTNSFIRLTYQKKLSVQLVKGLIYNTMDEVRIEKIDLSINRSFREDKIRVINKISLNLAY